MEMEEFPGLAQAPGDGNKGTREHGREQLNNEQG